MVVVGPLLWATLPCHGNSARRYMQRFCALGNYFRATGDSEVIPSKSIPLAWLVALPDICFSGPFHLSGFGVYQDFATPGPLFLEVLTGLNFNRQCWCQGA
jgi:hypothetical protein